MRLGEKLRELREAAGLTQEALAQASGVPLWSLRGYEQSRRLPGYPAIVRLLKALDADAGSFAACDDVKGKTSRPRR